MKLQVALLVLAFSCVSLAEKTQWFELEDYDFSKYTQEYKKQYSSEEFAIRKRLFDDHLEEIRRHNRDTTKSWKKGVNHMTDWTQQEFSKLLGLKKHFLYSSKQPQTQENSTVPFALPIHVDWREKNIITPVKNQGMCGSCWTFGTAESVESYSALSTGLLQELSEQQILDCTPNPHDCGGTGGCGGGTPELAYNQIMKTGGLSSEWTYPYISFSGNNFHCKKNDIQPVVRLSGFKVLPSNQYVPVLQALATVGPLAVNVDASSWGDYETGVFDGCNQTNPDIDHVVQLVGYGTDTQYGDYWIVRNSWGPTYGEAGYIRLQRGAQARCGTDIKPSDGTGCNGGPTQVTVCGTCGILYDTSYPVISN